ncbi:MAG: sulfatase-like hydrolase/transferase, partial [Coprobacter sp.]|nr:sulfatase-like hydrolase/transferase [Coprobacter sp.]
LDITGKAVTFIEEHRDQPFFLYFATQDAHVPRVPNERFAGQSGLGPRGDVLLQFDWSVGQIMETLRQLELDDNTIVILSSDNGPVVDDGYRDQAVELLGEHKPGGPFRGGKYSSYEAGTRVPCIIRWSGTVKPAVTDALVCQIDWFSTLAALLGQTLPEGAAPDSENYLDVWLGRSSKGRPCLVEQNAQNNLSITTGKWKYIEPGPGVPYIQEVAIETGNSPDPQLYNLHRDLGEKENVAARYPKQVKKLSARLQQIKDGRVGMPLR